MSAHSRRKGATANREAKALLEEAGWTCIDTTAGIATEDLACIDPAGDKVSVEVKADQTLSLAAMWRQTQRQADDRGEDWMPLLLCKVDGAGWWMVTDLWRTMTYRYQTDLRPPASVSFRTIAKHLRRWKAEPMPIIRQTVDGADLWVWDLADGLGAWS